MKPSHTLFKLFKLSLVTASCLTAGMVYSQQPPMPGGPCMGGQPGMGMMDPLSGQGMGRSGMGMMGQMDPAKMQAMMDKHHAAIKAQLAITPAQEAAWTAFTSAVRPNGSTMTPRPDPAEMAKLSTPARIEKMQAFRAQHMSDMQTAVARHDQAVLALYAVLTPEQQKVFDTSAMAGPGMKRGGMRPAQP